MSASSCPKCEGAGKCPACEGTGTLVLDAARDGGAPPGQGTLISRCGTCKGTGLCPSCQGVEASLSGPSGQRATVAASDAL